MAATNIEIWQHATVIETQTVASDVRRIVLEPSLPCRADPGTHIDLKVRIAGEEDKRSYSVVDSSEDGRRVALSVMKTQNSRGGSVFMHTLVRGDIIEVTQPLQNFPLRVGAEHYILLAGGIGITAVMNMARVLRSIRANYTLVYVGRSRSSMAYLQELQVLHGRNLQVHVDDEGTSLNVPEIVSTATVYTELYMCGPIRLMDAVRRAWAERKLDAANLRYETFGNSGWYDPEEFIVRIPRLGVEAMIDRDHSMLEALEVAGVDMMSDCRKGECGLCEVRILGLQGTIDHRDVFYSERQQNARDKMCCCVSRAVAFPTANTTETSPGAPAIVTIDVS